MNDAKNRSEAEVGGANPGNAGETGEFPHLSEAEVRGQGYVGTRPLDGGAAGAVCSMPYQIVTRNPEAPLFEGPYAERVEKILSRYPSRQAALLPLLNMAQEVRGFVDPQAMDEIGRILGVSPAYVRGVATFYTMYNKRPVGDYLIQVCTNVCCNIVNGDEVLDAFLEHTGTEPGEISADGLFTVVEAECLGACGFPVAVQINERSFENVTPEGVPAILDRLAREQGRERGRSASLGTGAAAAAAGEE